MTALIDDIRALTSAQKTSRGVSLYSRFVNRPLGRVLAALAVRARLTPNAVSALSATATACGLAVILIAPATALTGVTAALLLVLGFALDSADGQVARLTGTSSPAGEWLDHIIDAGKMVAVHAAVLVAAFAHLEVADSWLLVPLCYILVATVMFAGTLLTQFLRRKTRATANAAPSLVRSIGLLPADYGILAVSFALWGFPSAFIAAYTALFLANIIVLALLLGKWHREVAAS